MVSKAMVSKTMVSKTMVSVHFSASKTMVSQDNGVSSFFRAEK